MVCINEVSSGNISQLLPHFIFNFSIIYVCMGITTPYHRWHYYKDHREYLFGICMLKYLSEILTANSIQ